MTADLAALHKCHNPSCGWQRCISVIILAAAGSDYTLQLSAVLVRCDAMRLLGIVFWHCSNHTACCLGVKQSTLP